MLPGTYRIYKTRIDAHGDPRHQLLARLMVNNGHLHYLEDADDSMSRILKPGAVDAKTERRFESLTGNPYLKVVHEDDLNAGHHPEHLQVMDLGETGPGRPPLT